MSRFNLLSGLASTPEGAGTAWDLSTLGWVLVLSPFIALIAGYVVAAAQKSKNQELVKDIVS
ncbi:MAG: hypothetical protein EBY26_02225 [Microbacteriaceae bacterium]|nr:hypothetical protein [Microbacteriaceae bacterium]